MQSNMLLPDEQQRAASGVGKYQQRTTRFRRLLAVEYGKDCATFVVFDTEMSKLTKTKPATLALEERQQVPKAPPPSDRISGR
ncbi:uncharacterized protein LOC130498497 isoform X2 [Raphanus sativus]|uniref:Uncharacterized protein LOC130498497 isoform X2 n=1 Tax=Raphanus sativus TaxID=3726 RepID=A0A9W3C8Q0_RAPSA|nr:uncharacterized protein LOC130498497 isoform X2 [Raphanus sativus]XP_056847905.1 uncharacterized protein LOC130498497 isoform X2 [Raphanus sativus]